MGALMGAGTGSEGAEWEAVWGEHSAGDLL